MNSDKEIDILLDKSIQLEKLVAKLYQLFADRFPQDAPFWQQLCEEEKQHAALLDSIRSSLATINNAASAMVASSTGDLRTGIDELATFTEKFRHAGVSRETAFHTAIGVEESAGEIHYQEFMDSNPKAPVDDIFRQLNKDDKDHVERIRSYMEDNNISLPAKDQV
jgi:rubrerythrin